MIKLLKFLQLSHSFQNDLLVCLLDFTRKDKFIQNAVNLVEVEHYVHYRINTFIMMRVKMI